MILERVWLFWISVFGSSPPFFGVVCLFLEGIPCGIVSFSFVLERNLSIYEYYVLQHTRALCMACMAS